MEETQVVLQRRVKPVLSLLPVLDVPAENLALLRGWDLCRTQIRTDRNILIIQTK